MLGPKRVDTNSLKTTAVLEEHAIPVVRKSVVGDILEDLVREIRFAANRASSFATIANRRTYSMGRRR